MALWQDRAAHQAWTWAYDILLTNQCFEGVFQCENWNPRFYLEHHWKTFGKVKGLILATSSQWIEELPFDNILLERGCDFCIEKWYISRGREMLTSTERQTEVFKCLSNCLRLWRGRRKRKAVWRVVFYSSIVIWGSQWISIRRVLERLCIYL